jgi:hypothetical protein
MIEFIIELLLEFFGELLLQVVMQSLAEAGLHLLRRPDDHPAPPSVWLLALGYALLGAVVGGLSLLLFSHSFMHTPLARLGNLALAPIAGGLSMALIGAWRQRRGQGLLALDRFSYGALFGLCLALVRYVWAS